MILALAVFDHNHPQSPHPYACTTIFHFFIILFRITIGNLSVAIPVHMIA